MESLIVLVVSVLGLVVFFAPVLSIIGFVRSRQLRDTVESLEATVQGLDGRLDALARAHAQLRAEAERFAAARPPAPPSPVAPESEAPAASREPLTAPIPALRTPVTAEPAAPPPLPPPMPPRMPAAPAAAPSAASAPHAAWPPPPPGQEAVADGGTGRRWTPPAPPLGPPAPPEPPAPAFDWESLLGIKGAAWLAGIAFVIAALFLAKLAVDQGVFTPIVRLIAMIGGGTAALVWAELGLRKGYRPTADAISGSGIVTLYAGWFAAHVVWDLIGMTPAFVAMTIVTLAAAAISVRHGALFTAILGILGGLATPILLSSGSDRPFGLFAYLTVLNVGFLWVARKQAWTAITAIALCGTTLMQLGWLTRRLLQAEVPPDTLLIAAIAFAILGAVYLLHAYWTDFEVAPTSQILGLFGAAVPLVASLIFIADRRFAPEWPLAFGNVALLGAGSIALGLRRMPGFILTSAITTLLAAAMWSAHLLSGVETVGPALVIMAITAVYNVIGRLAAPEPAEGQARPELSVLGASGLIVAAGLFVLGFSLFAAPQLPPAGLVIGIVALLILVLVERTSVDTAPLVLPAGAVLVTFLARQWFESAAVPGQYLGLLAFPHVVAIVFAAIAVIRDRRGDEAGAPWWMVSDLAALTSAGVAYVSLHTAIDREAFAAPGPVYALLTLDLLLILRVAVRRDWTSLVPLAGLAAWLFASVWHVQHFTPATAFVAVVAQVAIYLAFVLLPFVMASWKPGAWRQAGGAWLTSAFIGPLFFFVFRAAWVEAWGTGSIGVLAVLLAGVSAASLVGIGRVFAAEPGDVLAAKRRLDYLALYSAIALGFIATAIALQLDRQWITIGWALEAAAVFWVFGLLPHPGLKYFGLVLFGFVGMRLLINPEVLTYEERGRPIVNWLLYTYGVPVLCTLAGAWLLRRAEAVRVDPPESDWLPGDRDYIAPLVGGLGLLLLFWLINLEIFDFYSRDRYVTLDVSRHLARDLTFSVAWGVYALALLGIGIWRETKGLRMAALGFLMLTFAKVFLYDLWYLSGIYRVLAFLGLGTSLIIVSLLYQRFVARPRT
jgi:uncharacterized membrane protein